MSKEVHDLFITDFDTITKILDETQIVYIYDTVAISHHEQAFFHHKTNLVKDHIHQYPLVITDVIYEELGLKNSENVRYIDYFRSFEQVLLIDTTQLYDLVRWQYNDQKAFVQFKKHCMTAFKTIQPLHDSLKKSAPKDGFEGMLKQVASFFPQGKNLGEYSILCTAITLKDVFRQLNIHFLGMDRDLYSLYYQCYLAYPNLVETLHTRQAVAILSTDTLLYLIHGENQFGSLVTIYRQKQQQERKVIYKPLAFGIEQDRYSEDAFTNTEFEQQILHRQVKIVY